MNPYDTLLAGSSYFAAGYALARPGTVIETAAGPGSAAEEEMRDFTAYLLAFTKE